MIGRLDYGSCSERTCLGAHTHKGSPEDANKHGGEQN